MSVRIDVNSVGAVSIRQPGEEHLGNSDTVMECATEELAQMITARCCSLAPSEAVQPGGWFTLERLRSEGYTGYVYSSMGDVLNELDTVRASFAEAARYCQNVNEES